MSRAITIRGYRVKDGRVVRDDRRLNVSEKLRRKTSKRVKPARRGQPR